MIRSDDATGLGGRRVEPGLALLEIALAVYADDPGLVTPVIDWFPTLSGRVSIGTFMGLEWTSTEHWNETVAIQHRIQEGEIPESATAVFRVIDGVATWELLP